MPRIRVPKDKRVEIEQLLKQGVPYKQVSEQTGVDLNYLYNIVYRLKLQRRRKRQESKQLKDIKELSVPQKDFMLKVARDERLRMQERIEELEIKNQNLEHQIIGFRSVISYLENMAGIRNSQ
jgi:hypothetical protein